MHAMIAKELKKIDEMDTESLKKYREDRIKYSAPGEMRTTLIKACDEKLARPDIGDALVVKSELDD